MDKTPLSKALSWELRNMSHNYKEFMFAITHQKLRIIARDGEPWFVLADVCQVLGTTNPSMASKGLDDDEKMTLSLTEGHSGQRGGAQSVTIVNEPGFYRIVMRSDKPIARKFQRWVTWEVLPSIRKTGSYSSASRVNASNEPLPCNPIAPEVAHLKAFAKEHCVRTPGEATHASLIWRRSKQWCVRNDCSPQPYSFVESMFISWMCTKVIKTNRVTYMNVGLR